MRHAKEPSATLLLLLLLLLMLLLPPLGAATRELYRINLLGGWGFGTGGWGLGVGGSDNAQRLRAE